MTQRRETESGEASPEVSSGRCRRARQLTPVPWCSGALVLRRSGAPACWCPPGQADAGRLQPLPEHLSRNYNTCLFKHYTLCLTSFRETVLTRS